MLSAQTAWQLAKMPVCQVLNEIPSVKLYVLPSVKVKALENIYTDSLQRTFPECP